MRLTPMNPPRMSRFGFCVTGLLCALALPAWSASIRQSSSYGSVGDLSRFSTCTGGGTFGTVSVTCLQTLVTGGFIGQPVFTFSTPPGTAVTAVSLNFPGGALPVDFGLVECSPGDTPSPQTPCNLSPTLAALGALSGTAGNATLAFNSFQSPMSVFFDVAANITDVTTSSVTAVPEPGTLGLVGTSVLVALARARRRLGRQS